MKEGESKKAALILMKNSHFDRTPLYYSLSFRFIYNGLVPVKVRMTSQDLNHLTEYRGTYSEKNPSKLQAVLYTDSLPAPSEAWQHDLAWQLVAFHD